MNRLARIAWGVSFVAVMLGLAACGSSSTPASTAPTSVTLQGSMAGGTVTSVGVAKPMSVDFSLYALYCVTFSTPTHSGNGTFDANGQFSVTVTDAAGLPVGCFITLVADSSVVTTLTFTIGTASGISGGTSGAASFDAGAHQVTITFDPVAKTASADVTTVASSTAPPPSFTVADLAGKWNMVCHVPDTLPADLLACMSHMPASVFLDVITAVVSGKTVYALGAWPDQATFEAAGSTEGLAMTLPPEVTGAPTSLTTGTLPAANPILPFNGFTATNYDYANRTLTAQQAWNALRAQGIVDYDWSTGGPVNGSCPSTDLPVLTATLPVSSGSLITQGARYCLLAYLENAAQLDRNAAVTAKHFVPQTDGSNAWSTFANDGTATGATTIPFRGSKVGGTPDISSRFALMDMETTGNTATAHDDHYDAWTDGSGATCVDTGSTNLAIVENSATSATGWFTLRNYRACTDNLGATTVQEDSTSTFRVDLSRGDASILVNTASTTKRSLDGKWFVCYGGNGSLDEAEGWMVAGPYLSIVRVSFLSTDGTCTGVTGVVAAGTGYGTLSNAVDHAVVSWVDGMGTLSGPGPTPADAVGTLPSTPTATQITANAVIGGVTFTGHKLLVYMDDTVPAAPRLYRGRDGGHSSNDGICTDGSGNEACLINVDALNPMPQN